MIDVEVEIARAGRSSCRTLSVAVGTPVKELVKAVGESAEGAAVLVDGVSLPMDSPVTVPTHLVIVPTFSGG